MASINIDQFNQYHKKGLLKRGVSKNGQLYIWNYSEAVQANNDLWDNVTMMSRALITDTDGRIVARSFPKFFNMEQDIKQDIKQDIGQRPVIQAKMDGSLGVIFWNYGLQKWTVTSRGSFTSEQSHEAQVMLETLYSVADFDKEFAFSVEIIYPQNRIVVDYGQSRKLVFLAAFYKDGSEAFPDMSRSGMESVQQYEFDDYKSIKALNWENCEGFVVRFASGHRLKIKFENYIELHRVVTRLSDMTVWEMWSSGQSLSDSLEGIPDEFFDWFKKDRLDLFWRGISSDIPVFWFPV